VSSAANRKPHVKISSDRNGPLHVLDSGWTHNCEGQSVKGAVPHPSRAVVIGVFRPDHLTLDALTQLGNSRVAGRHGSTPSDRWAWQKGTIACGVGQ